MNVDWLYSLSGFLVGLVVGVTGVGGGSLMTPLLVLVFGVAPVTAVGTDLLFAALTKTGGAWAHARRGNVAWNVVGWLAAGSIPASAVTLVLLHAYVPDPGKLSAIVSVALGFALILTGGALLLREQLHALAARHVTSGPYSASPRRTAALGAILGVLVTVSSVGAGALGVTVLFFLYPGLAAARIVGTDIAHAVPLTLVAGLGHAAAGVVDWKLLGALLIGSLPGIWLGSALNQKIPERLLRGALAAMLILIGGKLAL
ncbi:MAG TPA: sulfite exporter TauE/SafE family protein [Burkholderiales bacterium]